METIYGLLVVLSLGLIIYGSIIVSFSRRIDALESKISLLESAISC